MVSHKPYMIFARHSAWEYFELCSEAETALEAAQHAEDERTYFAQPDAEVLVVKVINAEEALVELMGEAE